MTVFGGLSNQEKNNKMKNKNSNLFIRRMDRYIV